MTTEILKNTLLLSLVLLPISINATSVRDPLVRDYITPVRIVWSETDSILDDVEALLVSGDGQATLGRTRMCRIENKNNTSFILDFGKEIHGGIQIFTGTANRISTTMRIRFGESVGEACSETVEDSSGRHGFSTNDHSQRDMVTAVSRYGFKEIGNTGFRFVRLDVTEPNARLSIKEIRAVSRYRDLPYVGSFHCSDKRLDSIWATAVRTTHLNMQEYLWDGIKRDRCIWLGDMHPEVKTIMSVFCDTEVVERSLDKAVEQYPLPMWLNGMSSYSLWYLIIQHDWFMQHGDKEFLNRHKNYITGLIRQIAGYIDEYGNEDMTPGKSNSMSRFLDWPSTPNRKGVEAGYRGLMTWALNSAQNLCNYLDDPTTAELANNALQRLGRKRVDQNNLKQASALMSISGILPVEEAAAQIAENGAEGFTTFYGYYMLEALAKNGRYVQALDIIKKYWGGMLELGATTFWEDFDLKWLENAGRIDEMTPEGKIDVHGSYGDYCYNGYRHSLCHGWSSGPCPWLSRHILGVEILEPGCSKIKITPHLCDLDFVEGTYPTPYGPIMIKHRKNAGGQVESEISAPKDIEIVK